MTMYEQYKDFYQTDTELIIFTFVTEQGTTCTYKFNLAAICDLQNSTFKKVFGYILKDENENRKTWNNEQIERCLTSDKYYLKNREKNYKSFLEMTGRKEKKANTDFNKAANMLLKLAKKECANSHLHNAFTCEDGNIYVTDSKCMIKTDNAMNFCGIVNYDIMPQNSVDRLYSFDNSNEYIEINLPAFETIKKAMPKKGNAYIVLNNRCYNLKYIYISMLSLFPGKDDKYIMIMHENNEYIPVQIYKTNNKKDSDGNNALVMPFKVQNSNISLFKAVTENDNVIVTTDKDNIVIGITSLSGEQEEKTEVKEDPVIIPEDVQTESANNTEVLATENVQEEKHNNVIEYIKKHFVSPVTLEDVKKNIEQSKQEDTNIYKIASVKLSGKECRECINNKKYIVYKHCVYKVQEDTKKGYTAKRIYKSNDIVPLVNPGMYKALCREDVQRLINQSIKQYYA